MKKFIENTVSILGGIILITGFLAACEGKQDIDMQVGVSKYAVKNESFEERFVVDTFKITSVNDKGEINGDLLSSTASDEEWSTAEGIYLLKSEQASYTTVIEGLQVGDMIEVTYDKEDYKESIWDNILDIEEVN